MKQITFRRIGINEAGVLRRLATETFDKAFAHLNKPENMKAYMDKAFDIGQLTTELTNEHSLFYFALVNDEVAGYIKLNFHEAQTDIHDPHSLEIQRIYVKPEFQNLRIGEKMLRIARKTALERALQYIWLGVWESNPKAIRFYERNGFQKIGEHPFQFGDDPQTDYIMRSEVS
ncbi:MAG TPA: GNAT family N-acetyltransferase [Sphingobacteriaceae bacterium]